jgi:hypothetical protein
LSWREERHLTASWSLNTDLGRLYESLRKEISRGPKFREPQHINWKHNFKIIMDAVEDYDVEVFKLLTAAADGDINTLKR